MNVGNIVTLNYMGGRYVKGVVIDFDDTYFILKLCTDYIGKNEEWYKGERKIFRFSQAKNLKIIDNPSLHGQGQTETK